MKFISLFVFLAALGATWSLSHRKMPVTESVHVGIQDDLKNIIKNYIEENVAGASDIRFVRMWSETIDASKVKAHFVYSFADASKTRLEIDGHALLNKISETDNEVKFSFDELFIQNQSIVFDEPMNITAGGGNSEAFDEEVVTPAPPAANE